MDDQLLRVLLDHCGVLAGAVGAILLRVVRERWSPRCFPLSASQLAAALRCTRHQSRRLLRDICRKGYLARIGHPVGESARYAFDDVLCRSVETLGEWDGMADSGQGWPDNPTRVYIDKNRGQHSALAVNPTTLSKNTRPAPMGPPWPESATLGKSEAEDAAQAVRLLTLCVPDVSWADVVARHRAAGTTRRALNAAVRCAVVEALMGTTPIRSWARWFAGVLRAPEDVPDKTWRAILEWATSLKALRARLSAVGHPSHVDDAPGTRDALTALVNIDSAISGAAADLWEATVRHYGGRAVLELLDEGVALLLPIALEYQLWRRFGADALVDMKCREVDELRASGVEIVVPPAAEVSHG